MAVVWINANLCDPPLDDGEVQKVINSILKLKAEINALVDCYGGWLQTLSLKGKGGATEKDEEENTSYDADEGNSGEVRDDFKRVFGDDWDREIPTTKAPHSNGDSFYKDDVFKASKRKYAKPKVGRNLSERR